MVRRLLQAVRRKRPDNHVDMKLGDGWHKRNYILEVILPSLFAKRLGRHRKPHFPDLKTGEICITWIGHASFLIQTPDQNVLVDPNWAKWLKIIKRIRVPGFEIHDLPAIDAVLVTHAHFDHLDKNTLRAVACDQPIVVPEHVGGLVHGLGFRHVHELRCWECLSIGNLQITLTPARHWGARVLHDNHRGFGGFHLRYLDQSILHCGDSAYFDGFREIGERLPVDIALLPIGAYDAPTKRDVHMNPSQALRAFQELNAKTMIPMHFGTFRLSYEPLDEPPKWLLREAKAKRILHRICLLKEGIPKVFCPDSR